MLAVLGQLVLRSWCDHMHSVPSGDHIQPWLGNMHRWVWLKVPGPERSDLSYDDQVVTEAVWQTDDVDMG